MKQRRIFDTIINRTYNSVHNNEKVVNCNDYILGKICGWSEVLCDSEYGVTAHYINDYDEKLNLYGWLTVYTTEEQYEQFKALVIKKYGNLCEFDAKLGHNKIYTEH